MNTVYDNLPIHVASEKGNADCVRLLLEAGADIDNKNEDEQVKSLMTYLPYIRNEILGKKNLIFKMHWGIFCFYTHKKPSNYERGGYFFIFMKKL